ncbi:MAG TPA: hypothetical protein VFW19_11110 [Allosphingosinicella sp.]|nr:hypothetical protein [Allosphingosinicella sp.]
MRAVIVAAALLIGTAAYAQDSGGTGGTQDTNATAGGQTVEPSNAAPKRDAHGVPVISAPATAPSGWNQPPGTAGVAPASQPAGTQGNAGPLPPCTRKVTDNCTQTYERNHGDAGGTMAAAGDKGGNGMSADTAADTGTKTTVHHRRHHRRHHHE